MHGKACTSRTLFHLLWHPRTVFLDAQRNIFGRKYSPRNQVDIGLHSKSFSHCKSIHHEGALLRALHTRLLARGVRLCASNVGFLCDAANEGVLVCNFIGVSSNRIAFVLARDSAATKKGLRKYLERLQGLLAPLLTTETCFVFFVLCLCTWRSKSRLLLRAVCPCGP